jgi:hypothetical protein
VNADLRAEAEAAAASDPIARLEWERMSPGEQALAVARAAEWRAGEEASARRAGFASIAEYWDVVDPIREQGVEVPVDDWPELPAPAAYHGVVGDLVRAVADGTEADPVPLLGTFLAIFGALAGHGRYLYQGSAQSADLYIVLVGETGRGRKGTAFSIGRAVFDAALPDWEKILVPGLGSGEGLIGHLKRNEGTEHRALVLETELGRLLSVMAREGSTLSPTLRDALGRRTARALPRPRRQHRHPAPRRLPRPCDARRAAREAHRYRRGQRVR